MAKLAKALLHFRYNTVGFHIFFIRIHMFMWYVIWIKPVGYKPNSMLVNFIYIYFRYNIFLKYFRKAKLFCGDISNISLQNCVGRNREKKFWNSQTWNEQCYTVIMILSWLLMIWLLASLGIKSHVIDAVFMGYSSANGRRIDLYSTRHEICTRFCYALFCSGYIIRHQ